MRPVSGPGEMRLISTFCALATSSSTLPKGRATGGPGGPGAGSFSQSRRGENQVQAWWTELGDSAPVAPGGGPGPVVRAQGWEPG